MRKKVSAAEEFVESLEKQIAQLLAERQRCLGHFDDYRAVIPPIRRAPTEIISSVFLELLQREFDETYSPPYLWGSVAWTFNRVCHRWREISFRFPNMWSHVNWSGWDETGRVFQTGRISPHTEVPPEA
ncbi:hypothetical protein C8J56DRAFT_957532 [Mycena floridula]|nr:hypothetical protein C8J56DRAFT_957532 [Mycena floridula]